MKQHITRAYNSFSINTSLGTITKTSKEERLKNEINYYRAISTTNNKCSVFFPRMLESFENVNGYGMELEYYAYDNLGDYMVYKEFDSKFWSSVAQSLGAARKQFSQTNVLPSKPDIAAAMYVDKTEHYYQDLVRNFEKFTVMSQQQSLIIDGERCLNFESLWASIKHLIDVHLAPLGEVSIIHGDFCFSNILCGINQKTDTTILKFVDPRGNFGVDGVFGDPNYDAAKLVHSYQGGYEYIIYDQFDVEEDPSTNVYNIIFSNDNKDKISEVFQQETDLYSLKSKLIEGLIYIGMCSRHYDSEKRQTAMYLNGIKILNRVLRGEV